MEFIILNDKLEQIDILDEYESLIWTDRYSTVGDFEIYTGITPHMLELLKANEILYIWCELSDHIMVMDSYEISTEFDEGSKILITGRSIESILDRRVLYGTFDFTGSLQDSIKRLLDENCINPVDSDRKIPNLRFKESTDPKITEITYKAQYSRENILEIIESICTEQNIGFKMSLVDDYIFEFSLYSGTDRSYNQLTNPYVLFSPDFENLGSSNYVHSYAEYKNVAIIPNGNGDEYTLYNPEKQKGLSRREIVGDSLSDGHTVDELGKKALKENKRNIAFEGQIDSSNMFVYGRDFFIGDIVQIRNEYGIESTSRVTELVINQDKDTYEVYPTFEAIEKEDTK